MTPLNVRQGSETREALADVKRAIAQLAGIVGQYGGPQRSVVANNAGEGGWVVSDRSAA